MAEVTERRTAMCRGCEADLRESAGGWLDAQGRVACIPGVYAGRQTVPHMPLPEGFRGAPSQGRQA